MVRIATRGFGLALTPLLVLFWGCGSSETRPTEAIGLVDTKTASGVYDVTGVTVQAANGLQREIAGTMQLRVEGDEYEVEFDLETTVPEPGASVPVQVKGKGTGVIVGGVFTGTTVERMIGVDPESGKPLDMGGLKIVSTSQAHFDDEGRFEIHLQNSPGEGQDYSPSVTVLSARRIEAPRGSAPASLADSISE